MITEKSSQLIRETFKRVIRLKIEGQYNAPLSLTPPDVIGGNSSDETFYEPKFSRPICEFKVSPYSKSEALDDISWTSGRSTGIYMLQIKFPEFCCVCMKPYERLKVFEHRITKRGFSGQISTNDLKRQQQIMNAICDDRFWYAVPFCKKHNFEDASFGIDSNESQLILKFTNEKFGKAFGELNAIKGKWFSKSSLLSNILFKTRIFLSITAVLIGSLMFYDNTIGFNRNIEGEFMRLGTLPIGILLLLFGLGLLTISIIFKIKYGKGENL